MSRPVTMEPNGLWRTWWIWTEPARLVIRLVVERTRSRSSAGLLVASGVRALAHLAVGSPWWSVPALGLVLVGISPLVAILVGLPVDVALFVYRRRNGEPHRLAQWRLAWRFHRQWPRVWTDVAAKTRQVQSMDGSPRGESRAGAVRPVVDHPRMPWLFWLRWPVVTFRIGVAPGRSFKQFEQIIDAMAANLPWVHRVELDYPTDSSSFGLLHVALSDALAEPDRPDWASVDDGPALRVVEDLDDDGRAA